MRSTGWAAVALLLASLSMGVLSCSPRTGAPTPTTAVAPSTEGSSTSPPVTGRVTVFAAASLADVFKAIGEAFTRAHRGATVEFNFASSSALATQLEQAAPGDVFASADATQMQRLVDKGVIARAPEAFARNEPVIIVPAANRAGVNAAADLARPGVKVILAAPDVPIGSYARQVIERLAADPSYGASYRERVLGNVVSYEANVRAVLTKIELDEADAGVVYRTDALVSGARVRTIELPESVNVVAVYPIGVVEGARNEPAARAFAEFVRGPEGQRLLRAAGFDAP